MKESRNRRYIVFDGAKVYHLMRAKYRRTLCGLGYSRRVRIYEAPPDLPRCKCCTAAIEQRRQGAQEEET